MKTKTNSAEIHPQLSYKGHPVDGVLVQSCGQYTQHNTKVKSSVGPWQVQSLKSATIKNLTWHGMLSQMLVVLVVKTKKS